MELTITLRYLVFNLLCTVIINGQSETAIKLNSSNLKCLDGVALCRLFLGAMMSPVFGGLCGVALVCVKAVGGVALSGVAMSVVGWGDMTL